MPFKNRIQQIAFIENQEEIEKDWDKDMVIEKMK